MRGTMFTPENYRSYFSWDKFLSLDSAQREELIKYSVNQIREEKGLKPVKVEFFKDDPSSRGSCKQDFFVKHFTGHTLSLNDDILSENMDHYASYRTFNTINHELEHASQFELSASRKIKNDNPEVLEQRLNDQHYYRADGDRAVINGRIPRFDEETDYQMYRAQACEAEARAAGYKAVEGLRKDGQSDSYLEGYLRTEKAREINRNRTMMNKLGMHSREEMAKEELKYIPARKLKEPERQRVLEYAREKDFETAKEVLSIDSGGLASEESLRQQFDSNQGYTNFYETREYNQKKVNESNHDYYIYTKHKWEDTGIEDDIDISDDAVSKGVSLQSDGDVHNVEEASLSDDVAINDSEVNSVEELQSEQEAIEQIDETQGDRSFFESVQQDEDNVSMGEDRSFFEKTDTESVVEDGEDQSFFDKVEQKSSELEQKVDEQMEGAAETAAEVVLNTKGQKR